MQHTLLSRCARIPHVTIPMRRFVPLPKRTGRRLLSSPPLSSSPPVTIPIKKLGELGFVLGCLGCLAVNGVIWGGFVYLDRLHDT